MMMRRVLVVLLVNQELSMIHWLSMELKVCDFILFFFLLFVFLLIFLGELGDKCSPCDEGECVSGSMCYSCPNGTSQSLSGQSSCNTCPNNYISSQVLLFSLLLQESFPSDHHFFFLNFRMVPNVSHVEWEPNQILT